MPNPGPQMIPAHPNHCKNPCIPQPRAACRANLLPKRGGTEESSWTGLHGLFQRRQLPRRKKHMNGSWLSGKPAYQSMFLKREDHLVDRGRRYPKVSRQVSLCRRNAVYLGVVVDIGQILALLGCEFLLRQLAQSPLCSPMCPLKKEFPLSHHDPHRLSNTSRGVNEFCPGTPRWSS